MAAVRRHLLQKISFIFINFKYLCSENNGGVYVEDTVTREGEGANTELFVCVSTGKTLSSSKQAILVVYPEKAL
jgi:hypothetical protein